MPVLLYFHLGPSPYYPPLEGFSLAIWEAERLKMNPPVGSSPASASAALTRVHGLHVFLTLVLFFLNILLTQLITTDRFIGRLKYIGHEMAFLSCGIVLSKLFIAHAADDRVVVLASLIVYVALWVLTLFITRQVLANAPITLTPLIGATLLLGLVTVVCSLSGIVEYLVSSFVI
jgi:hypothetical protein